MPRPKLDAKSETVRLHVAFPSKLLAQVETWRARQRPIPSLSEAIRTLTDKAIETELRKRERKR
jgi:metal-responsive CopG/Arc/MetJ family transcriptional regulator